MTRNTEPNELGEIVKGVLLLLGCYLLAGMVILPLSAAIVSGLGNVAASVLLIGYAGFFFWQFLYVLPLIWWLNRRGKTGMVKGIINGAVLMALLSGACYLLIFEQTR